MDLVEILLDQMHNQVHQVILVIETKSSDITCKKTSGIKFLAFAKIEREQEAVSMMVMFSSFAEHIKAKKSIL